MSKPDGGPAFPFTLQGPKISAYSGGMSLRDALAISALPAVINTAMTVGLKNRVDDSPEIKIGEIIARSTWEIADFMMAAREK